MICFGKYGFDDLHRISDPCRGLYRAFGLRPAAYGSYSVQKSGCVVSTRRSEGHGSAASQATGYRCLACSLSSTANCSAVIDIRAQRIGLIISGLSLGGRFLPDGIREDGMTPFRPSLGRNTPASHGVRILGVPVRLHFTFVLLDDFHRHFRGRGGESAAFSAIYILSLFASVLLHELGHAGVSKRYGIRTLEIVLYPIGGVARWRVVRSPTRGIMELRWPGQLVNVSNRDRVVCLSRLYAGGSESELALQTRRMQTCLARVAIGNLILAGSNMVPAFPMDGGRVLRSLLARKQSEEQATRTAASAGRLFAILIGMYGLLSMQFMLVFIAFFVYLGASQESCGRRRAIVDRRSSGAEGHGSRNSELLSTEPQSGRPPTCCLRLPGQDFPIVLGSR